MCEGEKVCGAGGRRWWFVSALALLVLLWLLAMFFRMELRAQWWAYRLTRAAGVADRQYYLVRLAAIGDESLGAVGRLLGDSRAEVRSMGITVLGYCKGPAASEFLLAALGDADPEVAATAALELALRPEAAALVPRLAAILEGGGSAPAWGACVALERMGGPAAEQVLLTALPKVSDADVRAQIIDSLGMLGSKAALPALRGMLADRRPISRLPASQGGALRAIGALQGRLASKGVDIKALAEASRSDRTVASVATRALGMISPPRHLLDVLDGDEKEHPDDQNQPDDLGGDLNP